MGPSWVVVDRFSKYATFMAAPTDCTSEQAAKLFVKGVVKYWFFPQSLVNDRDPWFTGRFWTEVFKLLGSELHFSTSFHPQTDGQTERVNALIPFRGALCKRQQKGLGASLGCGPVLLQAPKKRGIGPFKLATGQQPLRPHTVVAGFKGKSPAAYRFAKNWQETTDLAKACLERAAKRMKKWADTKLNGDPSSLK